VITDIVLPTSAQLQLNIQSEKMLLHTKDERKTHLHHMIKAFALDAEVKTRFMQELDSFLENPMLLANLADRMQESHILALVETWLGKEPDKLPDDPSEAFGRIINRLYHE
jgi:hypothetical protein